MRIKTTLIAGILLLATVAIAPSSATDDTLPVQTGTPADMLLHDGTAMYVVGLTEDPTYVVGDEFHGAVITSVNKAIDFVSVTTDDVALFLAGAQTDPRVRYITEDSVAAMTTQFTPNDPQIGSQWGWSASPGINAYLAWDITTGSTGVTVAVLDTGLEKTHEDIGNYLQGYDFVNNDNDPTDSNNCGHGTHVAGTVGALTNNGVGVAGTAQTTILPVLVLDYINPLYGCSGSFAAIANGITYAADQGADIITMSLGCAAGCYDQATVDAIDYAYNTKGALVTVATGNDAAAVGFPASAANAMGVGAIDSSGAMYTYSNTGPEVEIVGPGVSVLSTYRGGYSSLTGTSMATPHVAGVAALVLADSPSMSNSQVRNQLKNTADDLGHSNNQQGSGGVNACAALNGGAACVPPPPTDEVHTHDIDHWRQGSSKKGNVFIQIWSFDDTEAAESGVAVTVDVQKAGGSSAGGTASTGGDGSVTFQWDRIGAGTYTSCVTNMSKSGFGWDSAAGHAANGNCETETV